MHAFLIVTVFMLLPLKSLPALSMVPDDPDKPLVLTAERITYDKNPGVVKATGNVELVAGERILRADIITYEESEDKVTASGNVAIMETSGDVLFSEYAELTDQLRNGFIEEIRVLMKDDSRLAANYATRLDGNYTEMMKAVFSACKHCPKNPARPLLWQIKALKVSHNQLARRIDYQDAFLELYGIPLAYSPFFSHPDPSVSRKSGFLTPEYGSSSELGAKLQVPYYFALAPHRDITFSPSITSKEGVVLSGEFREHSKNGKLEFTGSITRPDERDEENRKTGKKKIRGHIEANGLYEVDPAWRWGFKARRSTDDTYLKRYDISSDDTLTSNAFIESLRDSSYTSVNFYSFQGLRSDDDPGDSPTIFPEISYSFDSQPGPFGETWGANASALILNRSSGTDSHRLSLSTDWELPYTSRLGHKYNFIASLRGDIYHVDNVSDPSNPDSFLAGFQGRVLPRVSLEWRYPLVRYNNNSSQTLEPIIAAITAPFGGNPEKIPNEDSQSFEFDDTNVFSFNRFSGLDRWEGGHRVNYGLRFGAYGAGDGHISAMVGQSLRWRDDNTFADKTGLESQRSDYVGRFAISPTPLFDYLHRVRLDRDNLSIRRNEIDMTIGPKSARFSGSYVALSRELTNDELNSREEARLNAQIQISNNWSARAGTRRDLAGESDTVSWEIGASYADECMEFGLQLDRSFTEDRDIKPSTNFFVRIKLKHLG